MLKQLIAENWLKARAVVGFFPANSVGDDDIKIYTDESRQASQRACTILRQQKAKPAGSAAICAWRTLSRRCGSGPRDYIGAFAVTAGIGIEAHVARFEAAAR